jgi:hypothetical protein
VALMVRLRRGVLSGQALFDSLADWVTKNKEGMMARLMGSVIKNGDCILWTRRRDPNGYARLSIRVNGQRKNYYVHHVFWTLINKRPIPVGMEVHHTCANRLCIKHVDLLSPTENMREMNERKNGKA